MLQLSNLSLQKLQHRQIMIDPDALIACLCEGHEHPACSTTQLEQWISYLGGKVEPKWDVLRITVVVGVIQLREHAIYKPG